MAIAHKRSIHRSSKAFGPAKQIGKGEKRPRSFPKREPRWMAWGARDGTTSYCQKSETGNPYDTVRLTLPGSEGLCLLPILRNGWSRFPIVS